LPTKPLRFGLQFDFRNPEPWRRPSADLFAETLDLIVAAEDLGYDCVWLTEHHFVDDGYLPSLLPVAAAVAARTKRIGIGTFVLLLPFHHPLRVAEDGAVVDILSRGRLRLGVGQGYRAQEFAGYGLAREKRAAVFDEALEVLRLAWTRETFSHRGEHYTLRGVSVTPRPLQRPHPQIIIGARSRSAIRRGARLGLSFAPLGGKRDIDLYTAALREAGRDPADYDIVVARSVFVGDGATEAWDTVKEHVAYQMRLYAAWLGEAGDLPGDRDPMVRLGAGEEASLRQAGIYGDPAQCAGAIAAQRERMGFTEIAMVMGPPGLGAGSVLRSMELFAKEVMPRFRAP
jgi:alkanesulfonate monooxygenase SsuD/methylene tetrahydromethanopterin reductase-like flavin-dependent oxidoreductase (luciferase family)